MTKLSADLEVTEDTICDLLEYIDFYSQSLFNALQEYLFSYCVTTPPLKCLSDS